jgi:hypothetical protein
MTKRKWLKLSERVVIDRKAIIPFDVFCCLGMAGLESMMQNQGQGKTDKAYQEKRETGDVLQRVECQH